MKRALINFLLKHWGSDPELVAALAGHYDRKPDNLFLDLASEMIGKRKRLSGAFNFDLAKVPEQVGGFEDCSFLFWSSILNCGIARLRIDEASLLFKAIRSFPAASVVEIGRYFGGSTFLAAAALSGDGSLLSIDYHTKDKMSQEQGAEYDRRTRAALVKAGLSSKVRMVVADSQSFDTAGLAIDLAFIDGDHSYEGVRRDFQNWSQVIKPHGLVLLHDAHPETPFGVLQCDQGVARLVEEIDGNASWTRHAQAGSLVAYRKLS